MTAPEIPVRTVPEWRRLLEIAAQGCLQPGPDPADPQDVAAYNEARRQLAAEAEARAELEVTG